MVMDSQQLDLVFHALSDATRRGILAKLSSGEHNVQQLTELFEISQPAISKHLNVLGSAGLIKKEKRGREQFIRVRAEKAEKAAAWIAHYSRFWRMHFDQVEDELARMKGKSR